MRSYEVQDPEFRVPGSGVALAVQVVGRSGFRVPSSGFRGPRGGDGERVGGDPGSGFRDPVWLSGFRWWVDPGSGFRVPGSEVREAPPQETGEHVPRSEVRGPRSESALCARQRVGLRVRGPRSEVPCKRGRAAAIRRPPTLRSQWGGREGPRSEARGPTVDDGGGEIRGSSTRGP